MLYETQPNEPSMTTADWADWIPIPMKLRKNTMQNWTIVEKMIFLLELNDCESRPEVVRP